ncbi:hypothetical protein JOF53_003545 [Crossiella equi]|uniref:Uncharacterized protein n=1 Tax=Crossiella equi TaxID=130796 RepID=A0ABS5ADL4_9PSEU|nr:hypothetical protein [Crossiella equi]MBP2474673.1 hypothetical protein [Crossiella equi]
MRPDTAKPGQTVTLERNCYKVSRPITEPESPVLAEVVVKERGPYLSVFSARVRAGTRAGRYPVTVVCGPGRKSAWLTVTGPPPPRPAPGPAQGPGQVPVKPLGGVETGGGELP